MADGKHRRKPRSFEDLSGRRFGRWLVIEHLGYDHQKRIRFYLCRCDCGAEVSVSAYSLAGNTSQGCRSCGHIKHGQARQGGSRSSEYSIWIAMKSRGIYGNNPDVIRNYRSRGIRVCQHLAGSYEAFLGCLGPRPGKGYSIDRENNNGHYSCGNCDECKENGWPRNVRWATKAEQAHNMRPNRYLTHNGQTKTLTEWAREIGLSATTLIYRLRQGMSASEAIATPRRGGRRPSQS